MRLSSDFRKIKLFSSLATICPKCEIIKEDNFLLIVIETYNSCYCKPWWRTFKGNESSLGKDEQLPKKSEDKYTDINFNHGLPTDGMIFKNVNHEIYYLEREITKVWFMWHFCSLFTYIHLFYSDWERHLWCQNVFS